MRHKPKGHRAGKRQVIHPDHLVGEGRPCPDIPAEERARIDRLAREIRAEDPRINDIAAFGTHVATGFGDGMAILIGDTSEIALIADAQHHHLDYRLGWLARSGDLVVIGGLADPGFEAYQRRMLDQPEIDFLHVTEERNDLRTPTPVLCMRDPEIYATLLSRVRARGGATLVAHLTTYTIWALAARLSSDSGCPVHVAGPPPLLSRRVNDKLWFGATASRLLGAGMVPAKRRAQSTSALTRHVMELARHWDRLVVKVPDSAGSVGNVPLDSAAIRGMRPAALCDRLRQLLSNLGWPPPFPVAVEVWDANVLTSPSVQTWIPRNGDPPVIEGVYEQVLEGREKAFAGAVEAHLPAALDHALVADGMKMALLFQALGYFGRCSFDAIVYGPSLSDARVHWIECNGRWGGVSVPMSLINRLSGQRQRPPHVIVQKNGLAFAKRPFSAIEAAFADQEPPGDLSSGVLFLSPNLVVDGAGFHFMAFGRSRADAMARSQSVVERIPE